MSDEYAAYLPHIDVNDGKKRVMNNLKLYMTLLGRFKGRQMADDLLSAIAAGDNVRIVQLAHALRGTAGNLSFPTLHAAADEIEALSKKGEGCAHLAGPLDDAIAALESAIAGLLASR